MALHTHPRLGVHSRRRRPAVKRSARGRAELSLFGIASFGGKAGDVDRRRQNNELDHHVFTVIGVVRATTTGFTWGDPTFISPRCPPLTPRVLAFALRSCTRQIPRVRSGIPGPRRRVLSNTRQTLSQDRKGQDSP